MQETQVLSLGCKDPLEKEMVTHSSILAGKFHGQKSLVGYSPWGCKESDMTMHARACMHTQEHLVFPFESASLVFMSEVLSSWYFSHLYLIVVLDKVSL